MNDEPSENSGLMKRLTPYVAKGLMVGALLGIGYCAGSRDQYGGLDSRAVAQGFLDVPNGYNIALTENDAGEREVYLQNLEERLQVPIPAEAWRMFKAYQTKGSALIDGSMLTIETGQVVAEKVGGETYKGEPLPERE